MSVLVLLLFIIVICYLVVTPVATTIGLAALFNITPIGSKNLSFTLNFDKGQMSQTQTSRYGQNAHVSEKWFLLDSVFFENGKVQF